MEVFYFHDVLAQLQKALFASSKQGLSSNDSYNSIMMYNVV